MMSRIVEARSENVANVEMLPVANVASSNWNWTLVMATMDIGNIHKFIPWKAVTISLDGRYDIRYLETRLTAAALPRCRPRPNPGSDR